MKTNMFSGLKRYALLNCGVFSLLCFLSHCLSEVLSPTVVMVSERGTRGVRLQWGPQQPESVQLYRVEYGALPRGPVQIVTLDHLQNAAELSGLQPDTEYLITVSAQHSSGQERAMSIKVCTQEGEEW